MLIVLQSLSGLGWPASPSAATRRWPIWRRRDMKARRWASTPRFSVSAPSWKAFISGFVVLWIGYAASFTLGAIGVALVVLALWVIRPARPADAREHL